MGYRIIQNGYKENVEAEVRDLMQQGWVPLGGIAPYVVPRGVYYVQAMVKLKEVF